VLLIVLYKVVSKFLAVVVHIRQRWLVVGIGRVGVVVHIKQRGRWLGLAGLGIQGVFCIHYGTSTGAGSINHHIRHQLALVLATQLA
jgi:hypothetical protein